ncbi:MAG: PcfJ domain-containing protein, partial [Angelakisella sp.]
MTAKEKRELLTSPIDPPPELVVEPETIITKKSSYGDCTYTRTVINYLYGVTKREESTLAFTVYTAAGVPLFRTFQTKTALISQYLGEQPKQSKTTLWNATLPGKGYGYECCQFTTAENDQKLYTMLEGARPLYLHRKNEENGYQFLARYQQRLREYDLKNRYDKIRAEYDNEMLEIRPLPKKVKNWVDSTLMKQSRYIFYDYQKGKKAMTGRCSHCGQTVTINHPHHKEVGSCPHCHSTVTYLAKGKYSASYGADVSDSENFSYFQSTKAGWCVRCFKVTARHYADYATNPENLYSYYEYSRHFYRSDDRTRAQSSFSWENFRNTGEYRFCKDSNAYSGKTYIYPNNLDQLLRPTDKYTPYREIAKQCKRLDPVKLSENTPKDRQIEYLFKLGLYRLCANAVNHDLGNSINFKGKTILEKFGLPKSDLPQLRELNPDAMDLHTYKNLRKYNQKVTTALCRHVINITNACGCANRLEFLFQFQTAEMVLRYIEKQLAQCQPLEPKAPANYCGAYNIRPETVEERTRHIRNNIIADWADYIDECKLLKLDITDTLILRPRDLAAAHKKTSTEAAAVRNKAEAERKAKQHREETKRIKILAQKLTVQFA